MRANLTLDAAFIQSRYRVTALDIQTAAEIGVCAAQQSMNGQNICCDVLAQGVIAAVTELGVPVPIVIRMEGTNVEEGKRMLKDSGLNFTTADSMGEAADKVVALAKGQK